MKEKQYAYRILFSKEEKVYELHARHIEESWMGFIEVDEIFFPKASALVLDPSEEKLKEEFQAVKRTYIPMHMILRIDEMDVSKTVSMQINGIKGNIQHLTVVDQNLSKDSLEPVTSLEDRE